MQNTVTQITHLSFNLFQDISSWAIPMRSSRKT